MRNSGATSVFLGAVFVAAAFCQSIAIDQKPVHLSKDEAAKLFPKELVGYKLKDLKIKDKSEVWKEYSATYKASKKGDKELKLVINDVLPAGDPKWQKQMVSGEAKPGETATKADMIDNRPAKEVKDEKKHTVMVLVGRRMRIDFKSEQISPEKLRAMAEAFDYKPVAAIAGE